MSFLKQLIRGGFGSHHTSGGPHRHRHDDDGYIPLPLQRNPAPAVVLVACPSCGGQEAQTARFCSRCGGRLGPAPCDGCRETISPGAKFCPCCGRVAN